MCVFNNVNYVKMSQLLLESLCIYGNLDADTDILIYTSTPFMKMIQDWFGEKHRSVDNVRFELNDTYDTIEKACKARLDLFQLPSVDSYHKILYVDTDVLVEAYTSFPASSPKGTGLRPSPLWSKGDINRVFDVITREDAKSTCLRQVDFGRNAGEPTKEGRRSFVLYVVKEGNISDRADYWGCSLFGHFVTDTAAFSSGIMLFNHCDTIKHLFHTIRADMTNRPRQFACHDQPYIVYNAFKLNVFDNTTLTSLAVNNDHNIHSDKVIHHFPGGPGIYEHKMISMTRFLDGLKYKNS